MTTAGPAAPDACALDAPVRAATLRCTGLLADRRVEGWDRLTRLAARVADAMAVICVADEDALVFMSAASPDGHRVPVDRTPLGRSLARHVIGGDLPLIVSDARLDARLHAADRQAFGVVAYAGFPLRTPDGTVLGCIAAAADRPRHWDEGTLAALADLAATAEGEIALRLQNRELQETTGMVRAVMDAATGSAVVVTDSAGVVRTFSAGAEAILGVPAAEVVGRSTLRPFVATERCPAPGHDAGASPDPGGPCGWLERLVDRPTAECELVRADGTTVPVSVVVTRFLDEDGAPAYLLTAVDVTERRRGEREREELLRQQREAVRQLQELDRAKSEFVANTSHELRTPVTSILGYTAMLAAGAFGELNDRQAEAVARVERNSHRLRRLIDDLLTLSHVEAGRYEVNPRPVDLQDVGVRACRTVRRHLENRRLTLELALPQVTVWADADALERVLANLLDNAVKYTPDGGVVTVSARVDGTATVVEVRDTGIGIPEPEQADLFTRFYRASANRDLAIEGTGLGLAISKAIIEAHHGTIRVLSRVGEGTKVEVTLPHGG